jgi:hypothetical protein
MLLFWNTDREKQASLVVVSVSYEAKNVYNIGEEKLLLDEKG